MYVLLFLRKIILGSDMVSQECVNSFKCYEKLCYKKEKSLVLFS